MTPRKFFQIPIGFAATFLLAQIASAHPGHNGVGGFAGGVTHPLLGIDHLIAMLSVGLVAANLGGRARWQVPLAFLSAMLAAGTLGINGPHLPLLDHAIACSVLLLGLALALQLKLAKPITLVTVAIFGAFHGYAHAAEMPADSSLAQYALGFTLTTAALLVMGLLVGAFFRRISHSQIWRVAGASIATTGLLLLLTA